MALIPIDNRNRVLVLGWRNVNCPIERNMVNWGDSLFTPAEMQASLALLNPDCVRTWATPSVFDDKHPDMPGHIQDVLGEWYACHVPTVFRDNEAINPAADWANRLVCLLSEPNRAFMPQVATPELAIEELGKIMARRLTGEGIAPCYFAVPSVTYSGREWLEYFQFLMKWHLGIVCWLSWNVYPKNKGEVKYAIETMMRLQDGFRYPYNEVPMIITEWNWLYTDNESDAMAVMEEMHAQYMRHPRLLGILTNNLAGHMFVDHFPNSQPEWWPGLTEVATNDDGTVTAELTPMGAHWLQLDGGVKTVDDLPAGKAEVLRHWDSL